MFVMFTAFKLVTFFECEQEDWIFLQQKVYQKLTGGTILPHLHVFFQICPPSNCDVFLEIFRVDLFLIKIPKNQNRSHHKSIVRQFICESSSRYVQIKDHSSSLN